MDKQKVITEAGNTINEGVANALHLSGGSDITAVWRNVMNPAQVELFDLALFCEAEMLRTTESGAHFSSCLMGAAMNEALMALMCLLFEQDVKNTRKFFHSAKKHKSANYAEVIANWSLEQFIQVSEECGWISPKIVDKDFIIALADGFRELMPMSHPELSKEEIESGAAAFFDSPGPSMLRMTKELRNAIHAGNWMRRRSTFDPEAFVGWCRFATVLCGEIRLCLLHHIMSQMGVLAQAKFSEFEELLENLPPEAMPYIEAAMKDRLNISTFSVEDIREVLKVIKTAYPKLED